MGGIDTGAIVPSIYNDHPSRVSAAKQAKDYDKKADSKKPSSPKKGAKARKKVKTGEENHVITQNDQTETDYDKIHNPNYTNFPKVTTYSPETDTYIASSDIKILDQ